MNDSILRTLDVTLSPRTLRALLSWPVFSITSYKMVCSLAEQKIMPKSVIDVGANVGQFAVASAKFFPDAAVFSVEPHPDIFRRLCRNVHKLPNIATFQTALGDHEGLAALHMNAHSHSSSMLSLAQQHREAFPKAVEIGTVEVQLSTLDKLFEPIDLKSPVLLKLDVQGYEAPTLRGGHETLRRVDYVVLETSFKPMYEGEVIFLDLLRIMECHGFRFSRPVGSLSHPATGEVLQIDALFERASAKKPSLKTVHPSLR
jgi:FkbM family methyltransferase